MFVAHATLACGFDQLQPQFFFLTLGGEVFDQYVPHAAFGPEQGEAVGTDVLKQCEAEEWGFSFFTVRKPVAGGSVACFGILAGAAQEADEGVGQAGAFAAVGRGRGRSAKWVLGSRADADGVDVQITKEAPNYRVE